MTHAAHAGRIGPNAVIRLVRPLRDDLHRDVVHIGNADFLIGDKNGRNLTLKYRPQ